MFKDPPHAPTEFPGWAVAMGFEDMSWKNDAMSFARFKLPQQGDDAYLALGLWVSPKDRALREDAASNSYPRFILTLVNVDEPGGTYGTPLKTLYSGEDEGTCQARAEIAVRLFEPLPEPKLPTTAEVYAYILDHIAADELDRVLHQYPGYIDVVMGSRVVFGFWDEDGWEQHVKDREDGDVLAIVPNDMPDPTNLVEVGEAIITICGLRRRGS